jgi:ABC-type oligopeptide transport system substrate-binding subunit
MRVEIVPQSDDDEATRAGAHLYTLGWTAAYPDPDGFLRTFLETFPSVYRDEEVERLLRRARSLRDQAERLRLYRVLERLWLFERAAVVPVLYTRSVVLTRPWIEGAWTGPLAKSVFDEVVVRPELRR